MFFLRQKPRSEVVQVDDPDIALAQRVLLMRGKSNILDNTYLFGTLQSSFVRDQIDADYSSRVKGIDKELRKVVIPFLQYSYNVNMQVLLFCNRNARTDKNCYSN